VGPRSGLDRVTRRISSTCPESNHRPARSLVAITTEIIRVLHMYLYKFICTMSMALARGSHVSLMNGHVYLEQKVRQF